MQTRHDRDAAHFSATELFRKKAASRLEQAANTEKSVILDKKNKTLMPATGSQHENLVGSRRHKMTNDWLIRCDEL